MITGFWPLFFYWTGISWWGLLGFTFITSSIAKALKG